MHPILLLRIAPQHLAMRKAFFIDTVEDILAPRLLRVALPMACLGDLPLSKLPPHLDFYGRHGVGRSPLRRSRLEPL